MRCWVKMGVLSGCPVLFIFRLSGEMCNYVPLSKSTNYLDFKGRTMILHRRPGEVSTQVEFERLFLNLSPKCSVRQSCGDVGRSVEGLVASQQLEQRHRRVKVQILVRDGESPVEEICA